MDGGKPGDEAQAWLEMVPERVVVCAADGRIVWLNSLALFLFGRPREELENRSLDEVVVGATPLGAPLLQRLHACRPGEGVPAFLLHGTGTQLHVELASSGFVGELAIVVVRPNPLHAAIDTGARTYELVFEGAPVGIFHFDTQGAVTACNDAFVGILGSPRRVLLGVRMDTLPDLVMRRCVLDTLAGQRARYEGEYRSATSGQVRSVRVDFAPIVAGDGVVIGGVGIAEDVTERVRAEQAWRRSVESFRALIERAPDAIAVHRDDRFLLVNPMLVKLLAHASDTELLARSLSDVVYPEEGEARRTVHATPHTPSDTVLRREVRLRGAHGETITAEIASIAIDFEGGPALLSFARDVTERRALQARLAQADRLASVGTLAAGIAHEINNPLAYVMLNLDILLKEPDLRPATRTALERAREGSERVRVIIRDLRIFSRVDEQRRIPVDVRDAISSALNLAKSEVQTRARLVRDTPPVPLVLGDEARLTQVMVNLIVNAAHAIPAGNPSQHSITVQTGVRDGWVEILGDRHRTGHSIGHARAHLRAVLDHQGGRRRHRARPVDCSRHRRDARGPYRGREHARRRIVVPRGAAPGAGRRCARRRTAGRRPRRTGRTRSHPRHRRRAAVRRGPPPRAVGAPRGGHRDRRPGRHVAAAPRRLVRSGGVRF